MGMRSAKPANMEQFISQETPATETMAARVTAAQHQIDEYCALPSDWHLVNGPAIAASAIGYINNNRIDNEFVTKVRQLFVNADGLPLSDAAIALGLQQAGLPTAARQPVTVDQPIAQGRPLDSGMSDDPVCTATGHFLEIESDLVMPDSLRVLRGRRTYSSRFLAPTSLGRGWYGWADAHLVAEDNGADYQGPDGQQATFVVDQAGVLANRGVEASVERRCGGLRMRWRWGSRFPGMMWDFGVDGRLEVIRDPFGGTTTCDHDDGGRLVAMVHQGGRRVDLVWEEDRVIALVSSDGRRVEYRYQADDLVAVERPSGGQRYQVDDAGHITEILDADGVRLMTNTYDDEGRVLSQRSPFGRVTRYCYLAPHTVVVVDDDGPSTLFRHDESGRLVDLHTANGTRSTRAFDEYGNAVAVVDFDGGRTDRAFDLAGNCVAEWRADGSEQRWSYDDRGRVIGHVGATGGKSRYHYRDDQTWPSVVEEPGGRTTTYESRDGLPTRVIDADGVGVTIERDPDGQVTALINDLGERACHSPHPTGAVEAVTTASGRTWSYELDGAGRLLAQISPLGHRRSWRWTPAGRLAASVAPDGAESTVRWANHGEAEAVVEPGGGVTSQTWDTAGNVASVTAPNDATWTFGYDGLSQLTSVETPEAGCWLLHWSQAGASEGATDPFGHRWMVEHDGLGRPTAEVSPLGRRIEVERDADGRPVRARNDAGAIFSAVLDANGQPLDLQADDGRRLRWTWSPAGRPLAATLPDGTAWLWTYDGAGRAVTTTNPDGGVTSFEYDVDGRLIASVNPTGGRTSYRHDADGRLVGIEAGDAHTTMVLDPAGRVVELDRADAGRCRFTYDADGRLVATTDALDAITRIHHDAVNGVLEVVDAKGAISRRHLDAESHLTARTDPLGRRSAIERDPLGRPAVLTDPDNRTTQLSWDPDGALQAIAREGQPAVWVETDPGGLACRITDAAGHSTALTWDRLGRPVVTDTAGRTTSCAYHDGSGTTSVTAPDGEVVTFVRDGTGRPTVIDHDRLGHVELHRDRAGDLIAMEADGFSRRWTRDPWGRVVLYQECIGTDVVETVVERDPAGRVVAEHGPAGTRRYRYDGAGQLVAFETPDRSMGWAYDSCGRTVTETVTEGDTVVGERRFDYDEADQLTRMTHDDGVTVFGYDAAGRRVSEEGPHGPVAYRWDALGNLTAIDRIRPDAAATETPVAVDGRGTLLSVGDQPIDWQEGPHGGVPLGVMDRTVVGLPGLPIATVGDGTAEWLSTDWRGTVGAEVDPWGVRLHPEEGVSLGYLGEVQMEGLVWLRNRVYDPATHAFLSPDPLTGTVGHPGALTNPYTYANNDPVGWMDPAGLKPLSMAQAQAQMQSWRTSHLGEFVVGALAVAGTVAIIVATGGAAAVILPAVVGAALGGGSTVAADVLEHKPIDPMNVFMNASVGGLLGAATGGSSEAAGTTSVLAKATTIGGRTLSTPVATGAAGGAASFVEGEAQHPGAVAANVQNAIVTGGTSGLLSTARISPEDIPGAHFSAAAQERQALYHNQLLEPGKSAITAGATHNIDTHLPFQVPNPDASRVPAGTPPSASGPMAPAQLQAYLAATH